MPEEEQRWAGSVRLLDFLVAAGEGGVAGPPAAGSAPSTPVELNDDDGQLGLGPSTSVW
jgi:hypothetical protein